MERTSPSINVTFGDGVAVIRRERSTSPIVAHVLGRETHGRVETVYLYRLVHDEEQNWHEWSASGAISTILSRVLPEGAPA